MPCTFHALNHYASNAIKIHHKESNNKDLGSPLNSFQLFESSYQKSLQFGIKSSCLSVTSSAGWAPADITGPFIWVHLGVSILLLGVQVKVSGKPSVPGVHHSPNPPLIHMKAGLHAPSDQHPGLPGPSDLNILSLHPGLPGPSHLDILSLTLTTLLVSSQQQTLFSLNSVHQGP